MLQLKAFYETLRSERKGNFKGDICILSTSLTKPVQDFLSRDGIKYHIDPIEFLFSSSLAKKIGLFEHVRNVVNTAFQSTCHHLSPYSDIAAQRCKEVAAISLFSRAIANREHTRIWQVTGKALFETYRNKHFSKLGILSLFDSIRNDYDKILLCDGDMIFQRPVSELFELVNDDRAYVGDEINSITPGTGIYRSNRLAARLHPKKLSKDLSMGPNAHELNVGVILSRTNRMEQLMNEWKSIMFENGIEDLFYAHPSDFWHEQDYMRLLRDMNPEKFCNLPTTSLMHLCNQGNTVLREENGLFKMKSNEVLPTIVHFPGASWKNYHNIKSYYMKSILTSLNGLGIYK
ncbi:hypothetical protein [Pelagicoccus albus]|uniref:Glycosyl transferase family 8 n=1 Tax=Pelagicoccus albus TaxID=415222 RepID=A0A7X1B769_9BACT|nr:hypothetical protein [Pelagicoccus albus]MBC2606929.1 hypothetical protein [Pelagicoccus albus]